MATSPVPAAAAVQFQEVFGVLFEGGEVSSAIAPFHCPSWPTAKHHIKAVIREKPFLIGQCGTR